MTGGTLNPKTSPTYGWGYDYVGLSGGTSYPGDPCQQLGSNYRTPTRAQWKALNAEGSKRATYQNVNGQFFGINVASCTNSSIAANCIFLPASGYRGYSDGSQNSEGSGGFYWSSTVDDSSYGYYCNFGSGSVNPSYADRRGVGFSVRCVQE